VFYRFFQSLTYLGFTSAQKSQPNLEAIGLYTMGIATCVGIGVLFQGPTHQPVEQLKPKFSGMFI
jgi:transketolase